MRFRSGISKFAFSALMVAAGLGLTTGGAAAGLLGSTVHVTYLFPTTGSVAVDFGTFVITGSESLENNFNNEALTFNNSQIILTNQSPGAFNLNAFDGYDIQLLAGPTFASVSLNAASSAAFVAGSILTSSSNEIAINVAGSCTGCVGGERILLDVVTQSAVPEPVTLSLFGAGLAGALAMRRRKVKV